MILCDLRSGGTLLPHRAPNSNAGKQPLDQTPQQQVRKKRDKWRADNSSTPVQQTLTGLGRMEEVEAQDPAQATSSGIKKPCACFLMLWFNSFGVRK